MEQCGCNYDIEFTLKSRKKKSYKHNKYQHNSILLKKGTTTKIVTNIRICARYLVKIGETYIITALLGEKKKGKSSNIRY